jgi:hypothetical protein
VSTYIDVDALTKVVLVSLLVGAGIPAVFALGVRALAPVEGGTSRSGVRVGAAVLCFAVCLAAVAYGVYRLVATGGH